MTQIDRNIFVTGGLQNPFHCSKFINDGTDQFTLKWRAPMLVSRAWHTACRLLFSNYILVTGSFLGAETTRE